MRVKENERKERERMRERESKAILREKKTYGESCSHLYIVLIAKK